MKTSIEPYLFFSGRCEEALAFYGTVLGAEVSYMMRYSDSPEAIPPGMLAPGFEDKIMHATFTIAGNTLMASDGCDENAAAGWLPLAAAFPSGHQRPLRFPGCRCDLLMRAVGADDDTTPTTRA